MTTNTEIDALRHDHVFLSASHDDSARRTLSVVGLTVAMMTGEIIAGTLFNSMALLADGFHMATHAVALGVAAGAYVYAKRHATSRRFTFGTGKVGDLAAFTSALVLGFVALGIAVESADRLLDPRPVAFAEATLIAVIGLSVNLASAALLGVGHHHEGQNNGHSHHREEQDRKAGHHHSHHHDNNLRSTYLHVVADALTSVLAIAALLGGHYLGLAWLDPLVGIVGAAVIASWSWTLLRASSAVLLDAAHPHLEAEIREQVEGPGDARITDLHVWRVGPGAHAAIVSTVGTDRETVRTRLTPVHEITHLTIEAR